MKKLFIGCGIVVLLLLGAAGFLVWRFWPEIRSMHEQAEASIARLNELEVAHPFDPAAQAHLDTVRFARALDLRVDLCDDLVRMGEEMDELKRKVDSGESDLGVFEVVSLQLRALADVLPHFAGRLAAAEMSWPEFAWHTRVLWATLYRVSLGVGSPSLEPLRDDYARFKDAYERAARESEGLPPLRDLIGQFPPAVLSEAETVMLTDLGRVRAGLRVLDLEHVFMLPVTDPDDLQYVTVPEETERRIRAEPSPPVEPEPASAPR